MPTKVQNESLIKLINIEKSYRQPNGQVITIMEQINLELRTGEIVALLGPSGSGKSTLMRIITGLVTPTQGQVLYRQEPMRGLNPGAAIVFQNSALYPWLTVLENVELGLKAIGEGPRSRKRKALRMIDIIGLDGFENAYPKELSGGMRQRVGFARALAVEPELLCMDEPFSALDVLTAENLRFELLDLWLEKKIPTQSILIVTHNIEEAVILADRIIVLGSNPGRVRADFPMTLPHYRDRKQAAFQAIVDRVYKILTNPDLDEPEEETPEPISAGQTGSEPQTPKYQLLPHVRIGSIAGLLELLENRQEDLYRLGQELQLELDDILPIVEGAKLMQLVALNEGDIAVTALGQAFIAGDIDQRKLIIRQQLLNHIRLVQQIFAFLNAKQNSRIPESLVLDILERYFTPQEANRQLDTAIDWGRYGELFGYDEPAKEIFLETPVLDDPLALTTTEV
ncbi:AAA-associated domain-containing protein [Synechococcus sp. PCC 6312]|uniref:ABC transporter ATP-binding protein n=1 Tax=Synechococcus sp. (strain ATCC 27167 / PCC 6312) TaxID=195253 RepID=UPI00029F3EE6|nr:nitrate/sulfonate/bicarbonate ABC transporter ATP-binding protein [Synechococcus sp. PCC 6312]AFY62705.1 ABC-type nitrate/sulfonate/bicarbonate transport system, ATPase component [Synechococcus sp. PCC 6312]